MSKERYFWIKLKTDFFNQEAMDLLLSQPNGCEYVVLYQMLCLLTANNSGRLVMEVGEMIVPYNVDKIVRETKYFTRDTVVVALELFKKLGLVYEEHDNVLCIAEVGCMVGSESANREALKKRQQREKQRLRDKGGDKMSLVEGTKCPTDIEYRVRYIEEKEKYKKEKGETSSPTTKKGTRFIKPTLEEISTYCKERNNSVNAEQFVDYYEANGWKVGKNPMKDWKAAVRTWERRENGNRGLVANKNAIIAHSQALQATSESEKVSDTICEQMFAMWRHYLGVSCPTTNENLLACKLLVADLGEQGLERLIVALRMRSEHGFLTKELTSVRDFVTLNENKMVVQGFYDKHWQEWKDRQERAARGKKEWEL